MSKNSIRRANAKRPSSRAKQGIPSELWEPITLSANLDDDLTAWAQLYEQAQADKWAVLFKHYNIKFDDPSSMAVALMNIAHDSIPGFIVNAKFKKPSKKRGRPVAIETDAKLLLVRAMAERVMPSDKASAEAIRVVAADIVNTQNGNVRNQFEAISAKEKTLKNRMTPLNTDEHREVGRSLLREFEKSFPGNSEKR